jgi:hypothetical protein
MFKFSKLAKTLLAAGFIFTTGIMTGCGSDSAISNSKLELWGCW